MDYPQISEKVDGPLCELLAARAQADAEIFVPVLIGVTGGHFWQAVDAARAQGGEILQTFVLFGSFAARIPLRTVVPLAERSEITAIELAQEYESFCNSSPSPEAQEMRDG